MRIDELQKGDIFLFRGRKFAMIAGLTNDHTPEVTHAICGEINSQGGLEQKVVILVMYSGFKVDKVGYTEINREIIEHTDEELALYGM